MQSRGCQSGLKEVIGQRDDAPLASRSSQRDISFTKRGVERASRTLRELRVVESVVSRLRETVKEFLSNSMPMDLLSWLPTT
jgi:hypothetical protein